MKIGFFNERAIGTFVWYFAEVIDCRHRFTGETIAEAYVVQDRVKIRWRGRGAVDVPLEFNRGTEIFSLFQKMRSESICVPGLERVSVRSLGRSTDCGHQERGKQAISKIPVSVHLLIAVGAPPRIGLPEMVFLHRIVYCASVDWMYGVVFSRKSIASLQPV